MSIQIRFITKTFGNFVALDNVSVDIPEGELVALLGPSGSGKTTLLRIIAGLETPDSGAVVFHGLEATDRSVRDRKVGFVFQHYALFRHMNVFNNIAFGLKVMPRKLRPSDSEIKEKVKELLGLVQLDYLADRYPSQLSGGQRQRVALARALAVEPKVLLLDEPFGALDAKVRKELRKWLRRLHDEINVTSVFVTHDQDEALELADRIVVMNKGRVEQVGPPDEVYDRPATPFVYHFLGSVNLFRGRIHDGKMMVAGMGLDAAVSEGEYDAPRVAYVRPHDIAIERTRNGEPVLGAVVQRISIVGSIVHVTLYRRDTGENIEADLTRDRYCELGLREGEEVFCKFRNHRVFAAPASDEDWSI